MVLYNTEIMVIHTQIIFGGKMLLVLIPAILFTFVSASAKDDLEVYKFYKNQLCLQSNECEPIWNYGESYYLACEYYKVKSPYANPFTPNKWFWSSGRGSKKYYKVSGDSIGRFFELHNEKVERLKAACQRQLPKDTGLLNISIGKSAIDQNFLVPSSSKNLPFKRIVIFGDSLSDAGNIQKRLRFLPLKPYWMGRFADNRVWPEFLGYFLNMAVNNLAYGGAPSSKEECSPRHAVTGDFLKYIDAHLSRVVNRKAIISKHAYGIWTGANNILEQIDNVMSCQSLTENTIEELMTKIMIDINKGVTNIYNRGGRYFFLLSVPNLEATPFAKNKNNQYFYKLASEVYQDKLIELARSLQNTHSEIKILTLPLQGLAEKLEVLGDNLGRKIFTEYREPCYTGNYKRKGDLCSNPGDHLFFDDLHPSSKAHCILAYKVMEQMISKGWISTKREELNKKLSFCLNEKYKLISAI